MSLPPGFPYIYHPRVIVRLPALNLPDPDDLRQEMVDWYLFRSEMLFIPGLTRLERWRESCRWQREWNRMVEQRRRLFEVADIVRREIEEEEAAKAAANGSGD